MAALRAAVLSAFTCASGCGPSDAELALQRQTRALRGTLAEQRQFNADLALRLHLAEARNRVLIGLVEGLTRDARGEVTDSTSIGASQDALASLDNDLNALVASVRHSRADIAATRAQRAALEQELSSAKQTLETLEAERVRQAARAETLSAMLARLDELIRDHRLTLRVVDNRMVVSLPDDVLFASNDARVQARGKDVLDEVAEVLKAVSDRELQVAGHTDARPVRYGRYPDNWRLSAERSINVMQYLVDRGVPRTRISAAAYADTRPRDPAQTEVADQPAP
jgi:chemotaxis protein MotB